MQYQFGEHLLDTDRRELTRRLAPISIGPQVFDLLVYLVRHRERVVSKDELLNIIWQGRIVSESTLTSHINAARKAVDDSGERQHLIRTVARKGFRFVGDVRERQVSASGAPPIQPLDAVRGQNTATAEVAKLESGLAFPDKPSIAVLPFQNLSGDLDQEYFADGIAEDIIAALSRVYWLFVIARNSSFTYKGRAVDVKQVSRELGVRYIVEGSVRKAADRVRIAGQLIDATTGANLWADRFEGTLDDIFDLQDRVTASVVGAIAPRLELAEIERAKRKPTESLDAYDQFLRGMASFYRRTNEANNEALRLFTRAIELDPDFASAYGMAAWCFVWRKLNGWMADWAKETAEAERFARRAADLGSYDAVALCRSGHALAFLAGDLDTGLVLIDRALALNSNLAIAWSFSGWVRTYRGELDVALEHLARAMRLSPLDPTLYHMQVGTALAHLLAGRYDVASSWAEQPYRREPNYFPAAAIMASSNALAGRMVEASEIMRRLQRNVPTFRMSNLKDWVPIRSPEQFAIWAEGLRKAGLPE